MITKEQIVAINDVISPLIIHKHHSINHVFSAHPDLLPFSKCTFYKYIDLGVFNIKNKIIAYVQNHISLKKY